jgi:hypothetical protein
MPRINFFILLIFTACHQLSAQKIKTTLSVEKNDVLIGDHIKTTLTVETKQGKNVDFPDITDYFKDEKIEILNLSNIEKTNSNNGEQILKQSFALVFWDSGNYVLPALPFAYIDGEETDTVFSERLTIKVNYPDGITGDTSYLAPLKPILEEKKTLWDHFLDYSNIIYLVIGILLIVFFVYLVYKRLVNQNSSELQISPERKAINALKKLLDAEYSKKGQHALYHEGVSFIVRTYLSEKFGIMALESITAKIIDEIAATPLSDELKAELKGLLQTADLVKYAKASPLPAADKFAEEYIRRLVKYVIEMEKAMSKK